MKTAQKHDLAGTRITFMGEPWFIEKKNTIDGVHIIARNLVAIEKGRSPARVLLEDHLYNWSPLSLNYGESVMLEGADTFMNRNPRAMSEIKHSGFARPFAFDKPEWKDMTLEDFADMLIAGKPSPLSLDIAEAKIDAISRYKNAPLPPQYVETAKKIISIYGTQIVWMAGEDANLEMAKLAAMMEKSKSRQDREDIDADISKLAAIIKKSKQK